MSDAVRFPLVLGLISLCSGAGLALSYTATRDKIRLQEELSKATALAEVFGLKLAPDNLGAPLPWKEVRHSGRKGDPDGEFSVYEMEDPTTGRRLYACEGRRQGYSSKVVVIVAAEQGSAQAPTALTIRAAEVVSQAETPGLGSTCEEPAFQAQFEGLPASQLKLVKGAPLRDPKAASPTQGVAAITGATVSSAAVLRAVGLALDRIRYHMEHRQEGRAVTLAEPGPRSAARACHACP